MTQTDFYKKAVEQAKRFEGFRPTPYQCSAGKWTIGYGLNLERGFFSGETFEILGIAMMKAAHTGNGVGRHWEGLVLTEEIAAELLYWDLFYTWIYLKQDCPEVDKLPEVQQLVLLDMAFNMGVTGLLGFKKMFAALWAGNGRVAGAEALDSKWAHQVGPRAQEHSETLQDLTVKKMSIEQRLNRLEAIG